MKRRRWFLTFPFLGLGAFLAIRALPSKRPDTLGFSKQQFAPCPTSKKNCVCSTDQNPRFQVAPLKCEADPRQTFARLKTALQEWDGYKIVSATDTYLHAEHTSRWMGFTDDLECQLVSEQGLIQVRSASRIGNSDLGVNRRRVEQIRKWLSSDN